MTRRRRTVASLFAAFALVFAQLAVSAHACAFAGPTVMNHAAAAHPEGCPGPDTNSDLCSQHCQYGAASVDAAKPLPAIAAAIGPVIALIAAPRDPRPAMPVACAFSPAYGPPPGARPLPLRI